MFDYENLNILWSSIIVEEFIRNGIDYFCISPGSRSSPIVTSVARNKKAKSIICYDERGAAFHALGYARATDKPAVVVTTSGTAVANCFPAVIEASMDNIPLIIISADRPPELQDSMANQTIEQNNIFGKYTRYFFNLPCPSEDIPGQMVLTTIDQAIYRSLCSPQGPVHINCMFREPLSPERKEFSLEYAESILNWFSSDEPYTKYPIPELSASDKDIKEIVHMINEAQDGLLIVGGLKESEKDDVIHLIQGFEWPVFLDIRSSIPHYLSSNIIPHFSLLMSACMTNLSFDVVLHIGGPIVSKHLMHFLKTTNPRYIVVKSHPYRQDPSHIGTIQLHTHIAEFCRKVMPLLNPKKCIILDELIKISGEVSGTLRRFFQDNDIKNEASLAYWISTNLPEDIGLFLSNSMPIRDMDMFAQFKSNIKIAANRGASGIDGIIATATGFAVGLDKPVTLIIGDLAFIHDLNSLFLIRDVHTPVIVILINNNGGGIFSFLDISHHIDLFEKFFAVPHNIFSFKRISFMIGLPHYIARDRKEFIRIYKNCIDRYESSIIEVSTDRNVNYNFHELVKSNLRDILKKKFIDKR